MKYSLLFLAALCLAQQAANAQEVSVRMTDDASKSITLGERMSPKRYGTGSVLYPAYSFDDTEYLYGHIDHYNTEGAGIHLFQFDRSQLHHGLENNT